MIAENVNGILMYITRTKKVLRLPILLLKKVHCSFLFASTMITSSIFTLKRQKRRGEVYRNCRIIVNLCAYIIGSSDDEDGDCMR